MSVFPSYVPVAVNYLTETEEALGPLPDGWDKQTAPNGKPYFTKLRALACTLERTTCAACDAGVTKTTTWIDPRTYRVRKHDIKQIKEKELPYGWDEAFDEECGIYYIDHNTMSTFLDAPWDPRVRDHILALQQHLKQEEAKLEAQMKEERAQKGKLNESQSKVTQLEATKTKLEKELAQLQADKQSKGASPGLEKKIADIQARISKIDQELRDERTNLEHIGAKHTQLAEDNRDFRMRLGELQKLNDKLSGDTQQQLEESKKTNKELQDLHSLLQGEAKKREELEAYILRLKGEVLNLTNATPDPSRPATTGTFGVPQKQGQADGVGEGDKKTAVERELELLALRRQLENDKKQREQLESMTARLETEKQRIQSDDAELVAPDWIKALSLKSSNKNNPQRWLGGQDEPGAQEKRIVRMIILANQLEPWAVAPTHIFLSMVTKRRANGQESKARAALSVAAICRRSVVALSSDVSNQDPGRNPAEGVGEDLACWLKRTAEHISDLPVQLSHSRDEPN
ncbi:uncharacterized protein BJ171DRAFT_471805 [Polychytrium aggregatum]|uniref:uncharacterized protein n=1 Tax=Polychytrium aggregatum TaxID=110093 RepID=UPI0022FE2F81|nr:uncharacterized protein BJ171DRAFT_471805 [Polychytrium aggregatum]KAI9208111.1 hypothetical protein BJ171DRAFT_471805 [Polychytrium aggregatum]